MTGVVKQLRGEVVRLQIRLYACRERLVAHTDTEALHDLRVAVRRLRSLLKPLKGVAGSDQLQERAKQVGRLTSPLRDQEVLVAQLRQLGEHEAADRRLPHLLRGYHTVAVAAALPALFRALDAWPRELARLQAASELDDLDKQVQRYLKKQRKRLLQALGDPQHDRHRTRLLVKRVRYTAQAYPELFSLPKTQMKALKATQGAIGDWHDLQQWLGRAELEEDLQHLQVVWQRTLVDAQQHADQVQARLLEVLS